MDQDALDDLKKFIAFAISQQISDVRDDIKRLENRFDGLENRFDGLENRFSKLEDKFDQLDHKVDDLSDSVAQAIHDSNDEVDKQLQDHETRITKLEASPA